MLLVFAFDFGVYVTIKEMLEVHSVMDKRYRAHVYLPTDSDRIRWPIFRVYVTHGPCV